MSDVSSPKATRQSRPRWLDPKLFLGILLVLASMALGARVIAQADQTVDVWALRENVDLAPTVPLAQSALVAKSVRFTSQSDADLYVSAREPIPEGARMIRAVSAGELLPRNAWTNKADKDLNDAPIPVSPALLPKGLRRATGSTSSSFRPTTTPSRRRKASSPPAMSSWWSSRPATRSAAAVAAARRSGSRPTSSAKACPSTQLVANASNAKAVIIKHVAPEAR